MGNKKKKSLRQETNLKYGMLIIKLEAVMYCLERTLENRDQKNENGEIGRVANLVHTIIYCENANEHT